MKRNFFKRTISALLILCTLIGLLPIFPQSVQAVEASTEAVSEGIAVMSYNVMDDCEPDSNGNFNYESPAVREDAIAEMVKEYQPDIIGMQEAGDGGTSGILDWCTALNEDLQSIYDYRSSRDETGYSMTITRGLIIFYKRSRFTLLDSGAQGYSQPVNNKRLFQWVKLRDNQNGVEFYVFNTHWHVDGKTTLEENEIVRTQQMQELADKVNSLAKGQHAILTGDFNSFYSPKNSMGDTVNITRLQEKTGYLDALMHTPEKYSVSADGTKTVLQSDDSGLMTSADHVVYPPEFYTPVKMERILCRTYTPKLSDHDAFLVQFNYNMPTLSVSAEEGEIETYFSNGSYYIDNLKNRIKDLSIEVQIPGGGIFSDEECTQSVGTELTIKSATSNTYMAKNTYYIKFGNLVYPLYLRSCNSNTNSNTIFVDPSLADKAPGSTGLYCDKWYCRKVTVGLNGFATIQEAVDAAPDGFRIMVAPGTYTEDVTYSGKSLEFYGSNRNNSKALVIKDGQLTVNPGRTYETYLSGSITFDFGDLQTGSLTVNGFHFIDRTTKGQITIAGGNYKKTVTLRITNNLFNCYTDGAPLNGSAIHANSSLQKIGSIEDNYFHLTNAPTYIDENGEVVNYTNRGITIRNVKNMTINANYFDGYTGEKIRPFWISSEVSDGSTIAGYGHIAITANRFENCKNASIDINNVREETNANVFVAANSYGGEKLVLDFSDTEKQIAQNLLSDKSKIDFSMQTEDIPHVIVLPQNDSGVSMQEFSHYVTFRNDEGNFIYAHSGVVETEAVYNGPTPSKAPTATTCYIFEQWVDVDGNAVDLNNITETIDVYAKFTEADHAVIVKNQSDPTCTENGYTGDLECAVCGNSATGSPILATGHNGVKIEAVPATCTQPGLTEGLYCSYCDAILVAQTEISATGHSYALAVDEGDGTHSYSCDCGYVLNEPHKLTYTTTDTQHGVSCICGFYEVLPTATSGAVATAVAKMGNVYVYEEGKSHVSVTHGMAIAGDYLYTAVVRRGPKDDNGNRENLYTQLIRFDLRTKEEKVILTDYYGEGSIGLGQASDMTAVCHGDATYVLVTRYQRSITMLKFDANGDLQGNKTVVWKGSTDELQAEISASTMWTSGISIMSCDDGIAKILIANYNRFYTAEIDLESMSLHKKLEFAFELDEAAIGSSVERFVVGYGSPFVEGAQGWDYQGVSYNRETNRIFMPICVTQSLENGHEYRSLVIVLDENGTLLPTESFAINEYSLNLRAVDFYGSDLYWNAICYTPLEHDCGITEGNRVYKMPMQYLETFSDATQEIDWTTNYRIPAMQIEDGSLNLTIAKTESTSSPWIRRKMRISFTQADFMAIRFKIEGCEAQDASEQKMRFSVSPDATKWEILDVPVTCANGWYIATATPNDAMKLMEVKYLQLMFRNVNGIDENSRIVVDYVYVGQKENAPDTSKRYTVNFVDEDGALLESVTVLHGTDAIYSGMTPVKPYDEVNHYTFNGWDHSLTGVTSDMVVTATFEALNHEYSYTSLNSVNHSAVCDCGYSKTEKHSLSPTASENMGVCVCGYTEALPTATNGAVGEEVADFGLIYISESDGTHASTIQGMAIAGDYLYTAVERKGPKNANGSRESLYTQLIRMDLRTKEEKVIVTDYYNDTNKIGLGHSNDMTAVCYGEYTYVFVTRYTHSLTLLKIDAEGVIQETKVIVWDKTNTGNGATGTSGVAITSCENGIARLLIANHNLFYTVEVNLENMSLHTEHTFVFRIDEALIGSAVEGLFGEGFGNKFVEGSAGWGYQGISYNQKTDRIFMPVCVIETRTAGHEYRGMMLVIDEKGTILPVESFAINEYSIELEAIDFYGTDLYWNGVCYTPVENDCGITQGNRIYKMPMQHLDDFSDATQKTHLKTNNRVPNMQIEDDFLKLTIAKSGSVSSTSGPWIRHDLRMLFTQAEIMVIKFRMDNCTLVDPSNQLVRFSISADETKWQSLDVPVYYVDGWYIAVATPTDAMKALEVKYLQNMFLGVNGVDETSRIDIDYIYVGPNADAPEHCTVNYLHEDGTLLQSISVPLGAAANYTASTPKKDYNSDNHYVFTGWDKDLTHILADVTVTAQFTEQAHSYFYVPLNRFDHRVGCSCGYSSREAHDNQESIEPPTCTARGYTKYTCALCDDTYVESYTDMLPHSYDTLEDNRDGTHSYVCACSAATTPEQHVFNADGICDCGASNKIGKLEPDAIDVVIDYAKPIEISVRDRAVISTVTKEMLAKATMTAEFASTKDASYGEIELVDSNDDGLMDSIIFTPKGILSGVVTVKCIFNVYFATPNMYYDVIVPVRIIPATAVYYETDFSDTAIDFHAYGSNEEKYQWTTIGEAEDELQDSDTIKDQIYDFVLDRGGEIPSNAFFADFTNDAAAKERYSRDITYANISKTNEYINYDESADSSHATKWSYNPERTTQPNLWWTRGRMTFSMINDTKTAYVQTGPTLGSGYCLNYHPEQDHFFQIRFKMENVVSNKADGTGVLQMFYYIGSNSTEDKNDGVERAYSPGSVVIPAEAFTSGEFITLTIPLKDINPEHTRITALRTTFNGIKSKDGTSGQFTIDYIYCGPNTAKSAQKGIDHGYSYTPYLYFNFSGGTYASRRYTNDSSYGGIKDYDSNLDRWVVATNENKSGEAHVNFVTSKISGGVASFKVGPRDNSDGQYGSYIAPTRNKSNFPWNGDTADYCLNFYPNKSQTYYAVVRFRLTGMKQVSGLQAKLQFTLIDSNNNVKHPSTNFTFANDTWIVSAVPLSSSLNALGSCIKSFYVRPANVTTKSVTDYGKIEIDYIYVGPLANNDTANAHTWAYSHDANERALFVDFRNSAYDQYRYTSRAYCHTNLDTTGGWNNAYWFNYNMNNNTGILKLTPTANYDGWGQIEANTSSKEALLNYRMTGNDYAVVRMRHNGLNTSGGSPKLRFVVGTGTTAGLPGDSGVTAYQADAPMNVSNNGKWVTYYMDLSAFKAGLNSKITFFRVITNQAKLNSGGSFEIDYIYIGPVYNVGPPEDSIYYGFDNTQADRDRYNSKTYNYVNHDLEGTNSFNLAALENPVISNKDSTLTLTATAGSANTFYIEPKNTFDYHPKSKAVQVRFKLQDFVPVEGTNPYFTLQYKHNGTYYNATAVQEFNPWYLSNGQYLTIFIDINEANALNIDTNGLDFYNMASIQKLRFVFGGFQNAANTQGKITIDYIYVGPKDGKLGGDMTYGYDSSYDTDGEFSNGSSYKVEGLGIPNFNPTDHSIDTEKTMAYTESTFTFTGTGFDIIGRTGEKQGLVRVMVYDTEGNFIKIAQVLNKSDTKTETYQVPVLSVKIEDPETNEPLHGTYIVKVYVAAANDFSSCPDGTPDGDKDIYNGVLDRGGEFYYDAIRIYNTIDTDADSAEAEVANDVYWKHGEADPTFHEVRSFVIDPEKYNPVGDSEGVLYYEPGEDQYGNKVETYSEVSPNNEVYLNPGKAIVFKLEVEGEIPASVDIGAKRINDASASMTLGIGKNAPSALPGNDAINIASAAAQYYKLDVKEWNTDGSKHWIYITIYNSGSEGVLSITNVKYAYEIPTAVAKAAEKSVRFIVDADLMKKLTTPCVHAWDDGAVSIAATCMQAGEKLYSCANCDETRTEEIAQLEHTYINGTCVCGATNVKEPILDENLTFNMSISVGAEMQVFYSIKDSGVAAYDCFYLEVAKDVAGGESVKTTYSLDNGNVTIKKHSTTGEVTGYMATYTGIFASEMGDNFTATLYAVASNGTIYCGIPVSTSIKSYLTGKLNDANSSAELKRLAVDMLNYGAAAQMYFGYDTENLVNSDLTEAQKALGTQTIPTAEDGSSVTGDGCAVVTSVSLQSKVMLYLTFRYRSAADSNLTVVMKDAEGKILSEYAPYQINTANCKAIYDDVGAKQMRDLITIELCDNGVVVSQSLVWSVESYVASIRTDETSSAELIAVADAMLAYGDSAAAYLAATGQ